MSNTLYPESESDSAKKREIIKHLVEGHEAASQLKVLLENPFETQHSLSSLANNVLRSFTEALSIINSSPEPGFSANEVAHPNLVNSGENGSPAADAGNESKKISQKGGRGRYNRRKSALAWTIVSCNTDDDHAWRKYGQKEIMNSEFPRSYFRCSHKYDQGCGATKQVQRDQENPDVYQITYIGIHTCNAATPNATHSATASGTTAWESYLVNSDRESKVPNVQDNDHHNSSPSIDIKQELPKEDTPSDITYHKLDPSLWSDLKDFEPYIQAYHCALKD